MSTLNEKKISIIIPIKNMEKYVVKCLESILDSTYKNLEIIFIDFGSQDKSISIVNLYQRKYANIKVYVDATGNVASARNKGILYAEGEYIIFLDCDDWIDSKMIENLYIEAERKNLDIVNCSYYNVYENGDKKEKIFEEWFTDGDIKLLDNVISEIALGKINLEVWTKLYRTDYIKKSAAYFDDENGVNGEDVFFNMLLLMSNPKLGNVSNPLYYHLIRENSLAHKKDKELTERFLTIIEKLRLNSKNIGIKVDEGLAQLFLSLIIQDLVENTTLEKRRKKIIKYLNYQCSCEMFENCQNSKYSTFKRKVLCFCMKNKFVRITNFLITCMV